MSLIEDAAKRLEQLRSAGVRLGPERPELRPPPGRAAGEAPPPKRTSPGPQTRLVTLDLQRLADAGYLVPDAPRSVTADEFRVLKRPLIANASDRGTTPLKHGNLIMVTSALPGEGKTFTAVNLALSIAQELDRTVLLVDADVARPALPSLLGLPSGRGLLDALQKPSLDIGQFMLRTNIPHLSILPAGTHTPRATELLASEGMARLLQELATRYSDRIVVFDTPPLLVTTEARVLASQVGQVVVVVQAEVTPQAQVKQALVAIESCPVKLLVLNMVESRAQGAYGYGYAYDHDHR